VASLNHLHLHVKDLAASRRFYERWFGLRESAVHHGIVFLRDDTGLDLALAPDPKPARLPKWFHVGFRLPTAKATRELHRRMKRAKARRLGALYDEPDMVWFRAYDPDGVRVDVYWE